MKLIIALLGLIALTSAQSIMKDIYVGLDEHIEAINS